ncbi:MAG: ComEC/Rec2 family competence protein [Flavobacteriales bacterium]
MKPPGQLYGLKSAIVRAPMVRAAVPFMLGIASGMLRTPSLVAAGTALTLMSLTIAVVLLLPVFRDSRWERGVSIALWCFVFGLFWGRLRDPANDLRHVTNDATMEGPWALRVEVLNGITEKLVRADAAVLGRSLDGVWRPRSGKVMLTLMRRSGERDPRVGDEVLVDAPLEPIDRVADPGGFDRRAWAASRGMEMELFAPPEDWAPAGHAVRWTDVFASTRDRISGWMEQTGLPLRERALVKALVLGLRDDLDGEQKNAFVRSGTVHVLAVSGTHVGFIYVMLSFLLGWWGGGRKARLFRGVLVLLALWGYAGLTGACPSVLRATFMFSLFTLAGMLSQRVDTLNSLFAAALVLLLWDPHMLVEVSFQLSFLAVLGIVLFYGPLQRLWSPDNWLLRNVWALTVMSLSAQLFTTPLSLYLFKAFPVWFLPANLVVVTAAGFAVYGAVALLVLFKVPFLGAALTWAMTLLLAVVDRVTLFFAELPGSYPAVRIGLPEMLLLYLLVSAFAAHWLWRWRGGRWLIAGTVAALLVGWGLRAMNLHERTTFTIYDDRRALQASLTVGRTLVVLCDADSFATDTWLQQKVERHERAVGLNAPLFLSPTTLAADTVTLVGPSIAAAHRWSGPGVRVAFFDHDYAWPAVPAGTRLDAVVLHDLQFVEASTLEPIAASTDHIVLAGAMSWRARNFARQWCADHDIACHDVRDQGAFILER